MDGIGQPPIGASPNPADWEPPINISPAVEFQIPENLFSDWPLDFGQGDVFDWLGDVQAQQGQQVAGPVAEVFDFAPPQGAQGWEVDGLGADHVG